MSIETKNLPSKFIKKIMDLSGGMNDKHDATKIEDNQFANIVDFKYDSVGNLELRGGCTALTLDGGSNAAKYYTRWTRDSGSTLEIIGHGGKISYKNGMGLTDLVTGLTSASQVCCESWTDSSGNDYLLVVSDGDSTNVVDGSTLTSRTAGCTAPTSAPSTSFTGAGSLTGDYIYGYSFIYPWGESSVSPACSTVSPSSQEVRVTLGEAYPTNATGAKIYRSIDAGSSLLQLATITSPTTIYDDQISDGALGTEAPDDNGAPPNAKWVKIYKNYAYYLDGTDQVWYSDLNYPEIVQSSSYDNPIIDSDNRPTCVHYTLNPNFLVWFYEKSLVAYSGTSPFATATDPLVKKEINFDLGCPAPYSVVQTNGDLIFLGSDKRIHVISRVSLAAEETIEPISLSDPVDGTMQNDLNASMLDKAYGIYNNRKYHLYVATGNNSHLDTLVTVDFNLKGAPWVTNTPISGRSIGLYNDDDGNDQVVLGSSTSPNIYQFYEGSTDGGSSIEPEFTSKKWTIDHPFNRKAWKQLRLMGEATPEFSFKVRIYVEKQGEQSFHDYNVTGTATSSTLADVTWVSTVTFGQGNFCSNVSWSSLVSNFFEYINLGGDEEKGIDGEVMWFRVYDVNSAYSLKFKGFEIRGILYRAR